MTMIPFISTVGEAIASKPTLNTNCGEPGNTNSGKKTIYDI